MLAIAWAGYKMMLSQSNVGGQANVGGRLVFGFAGLLSCLIFLAGVTIFAAAVGFNGRVTRGSVAEIRVSNVAKDDGSSSLIINDPSVIREAQEALGNSTIFFPNHEQPSTTLKLEFYAENSTTSRGSLLVYLGSAQIDPFLGFFGGGAYKNHSILRWVNKYCQELTVESP